jgi:hypothetical protein
MIIAMLAALVGSGLGSGVRAGVSFVEQRLGIAETAAEPTDTVITVNGSLVSALVAGTIASTLGRGARFAFWLGAVLGAAGADRLDLWLLRRLGVDPEKLMAQARDAATQQAARARARMEGESQPE